MRGGTASNIAIISSVLFCIQHFLSGWAPTRFPVEFGVCFFSSSLAKLPALFSSALFWAHNVFLLSLSYYSSSEIPSGIWSLRWKAKGLIGIFSAKEAVVLYYSFWYFPPYVASQQCLIRALFASVTFAEWVCNDVAPYVLPNLYPTLSAPDRLSPPQTAKHGQIMSWMVSHHMERLATFKPLLFSLYFTLIHN